MAKKAAAAKTAKPASRAAAPAPAPAETSDGEGTLTRDGFFSRMNSLAAKNGQPQPAETPAGDPPAPSEIGDDPLAAMAAVESELAGDGKPAQPVGDGNGARTLKTVAETLGISVEDAYAIELSIDVDGKGAETRTIGQLKDSLTAVANLDARVLEFEETREREQNEMLRQRQELQEIFAAMPKGAVPKALLDKARERAQAHREAEAERVLEVIPEWSDDQRQANDVAGIKAHLAEYGLDSLFYDGAVDHRFKKYMRDNWRRLTSVREAMKNVTEIKPNERPPAPRREAGNAPNGRTVELPDAGPTGRSLSQLRSTFSGLRQTN